MAASLSVQEVLGEVWRESDDERSDDEVIEEVDREKETLVKWIEEFEGGDGFDDEFFRGKAMELMLPVAHLSARLKNYSSSEADTRTKVATILSTSTITTGSVLDHEARLWLKFIYRRLAGRLVNPCTMILPKNQTAGHLVKRDDSQIYMSFKPSHTDEPELSKLKINNMKWKFLLLMSLFIVMVVLNADGWFFGRRRRNPPPRPQPPPGPSPRCQALTRRYSVVSGNNLHELARQWAPAVKLARGEQWRPSSVDFFLRHVNLHGGPNYNPLTSHNLPGCNRNCCLSTKEELGCASCTRPGFLRGESPSSVPVYTTIHVDGNVVEIIYRFFYPYNRGKRVCVGIYFHGCIGGYSTFGHHVGDWEHVKVRFVDNKLHSMFLQTHSSEITQEYVGTFRWNGQSFQKGHRQLKMEQCTHGVVYSADGSHGFWPSVGRHVYIRIVNGDTLVDNCSNGDAWNTWQNLKITKNKEKGQYRGEFQFMNFEGRWGNRRRRCEFEKVIKSCILENGIYRKL
ncbi:hypothetical protein QZH41_007041 [Actinostola sp. cb2023]|nr:hypothetical protein QZH41_007041 [Actinostola sp. cb2023]